MLNHVKIKLRQFYSFVLSCLMFQFPLEATESIIPYHERSENAGKIVPLEGEKIIYFPTIEEVLENFERKFSEINYDASKVEEWSEIYSEKRKNDFLDQLFTRNQFFNGGQAAFCVYLQHYGVIFLCTINLGTPKEELSSKDRFKDYKRRILRDRFCIKLNYDLDSRKDWVDKRFPSIFAGLQQYSRVTGPYIQPMVYPCVKDATQLLRIALPIDFVKRNYDHHWGMGGEYADEVSFDNYHGNYALGKNYVIHPLDIPFLLSDRNYTEDQTIFRYWIMKEGMDDNNTVLPPEIRHIISVYILLNYLSKSPEAQVLSFYRYIRTDKNINDPTRDWGYIARYHYQKEPDLYS